jgi:hypothetical protein
MKVSHNRTLILHCHNVPMFLFAGDTILQSPVKRKLQQDLHDSSALQRQTREDLAFIANLLSDVDPVTGQVQLDSITFSEVFELFARLNGDAVILPARSYVHSIWTSVVKQSALSIRDVKTVSKCDRCIQLRSAIQNVSLTQFRP